MWSVSGGSGVVPLHEGCLLRTENVGVPGIRGTAPRVLGYRVLSELRGAAQGAAGRGIGDQLSKAGESAISSAADGCEAAAAGDIPRYMWTCLCLRPEPASRGSCSAEACAEPPLRRSACKGGGTFCVPRRGEQRDRRWRGERAVVVAKHSGERRNGGPAPGRPWSTASPRARCE